MQYRSLLMIVALTPLIAIGSMVPSVFFPPTSGSLFLFEITFLLALCLGPSLLFSYLGRSLTGARLYLYLASLVAGYPIWWLLFRYGAMAAWPTQIALLSIDLPAAMTITFGILLKSKDKDTRSGVS